MRRSLTSSLAAVALAATALTGAGAAPAAAAPSTSSACPAGQVPSSGFSDVPPGSVDIDCLVWWGVTTGSSSTTYGGAGTVSRGQMASFLARTVARAGGVLPDVPPWEDRFWDDTGTLHEPSTNSLAALNIVAGSGNGQFRPGDAVRRDQMASFLVRTAEHLLARQLPSTPGAFPDDDGNVHEAAIDKVAAAGITTGKSDGSYDPSGLVTRVQMASFLVRTIDVVVRDRLRLVRVQRSGLQAGDLPPLVVAEGPAARSVPEGGTFGVHPGARLYLPPVSQQGELRLPETSPVPVGQEGGLQELTVAHVPGDARVAAPDNSAAVAAYFQHWFVTPAATPADWTGSLAGCDAGSTSQAYRSAQLDAVNAARRLADLPAGDRGPRLVGEGAGDGAGDGRRGRPQPRPAAVVGVLDGERPRGRAAQQPRSRRGGRGHRRRLPGGPGPRQHRHRAPSLAARPPSTRMGFGDVFGQDGPDANAIWVVDEEAGPPADEQPVTWPAPGHFPEQLIGATGRWSVSAPGVDLSARDGRGARRRPAGRGRGRPRRRLRAGGESGVVFTVPGASAYRVVTVTVRAPKEDGRSFEHTWTTTLVR